ncbi:hypothetical protein E1B00_13140 [Arenimonas terrae]|uniref:Flagellar basal-body/hook protein C-terminal domain-containing protein n=2 Tax=Arenimonas terrae TaxID=2546226 RepID=A0A5C4RS41_9GAMM|nr:hypothetical protein E1B00_13140 [Arenimonas terrae]
MTYERLRLDAASRNIAGANRPIASGEPATLWRPDPVAGLAEREAAARLSHEPGHPLADADGMVRYPAVDMVDEMTTLMTASRAYEANVRAFNLLRSMLMRALEIGAK